MASLSRAARLIDVPFAATVLHYGCKLLHNDRDFDPVAARFPLIVV
jgi:predicted nucleic acid-binding protein